MKVGIYKDPAGAALGGTEYCVAVLAEELCRAHEVEVVHHTPWVQKEHFADFFGTELDGVSLRYVAPQPVSYGASRLPWRRYRQARAWMAELSEPYDFFIAFTHGTPPPPHCHAPQGMFVVLFPFFDRRNELSLGFEGASPTAAVRQFLRRTYYDWDWRRRLESYQLKTAISEFSREWVQRRWGVDCAILSPPVNTDFGVADKEDVILNVGRLTPFKKQLELVAAFRRLEELRARGWQLLCAGGVEGTAQDRLYCECVRCLGADHQVRVIGDIKRAELKRLYEKAKIFWHAVGLNEDDKTYPEMTEHFGIVTVEAMAAGCVPVVIRKGGQPEIVEHGRSGFLWNTEEELLGYTALLACDEPLRARMSETARERARYFSNEKFIERFYALAPQLRPSGRDTLSQRNGDAAGCAVAAASR